MRFVIKHLDATGRAKLLQAMHRAATPGGGLARFSNVNNLSLEACRSRLDIGSYVDYLAGLPIKCDFGGDTIDTWLYERDHGHETTVSVMGSMGLEVGPIDA